ncbi:hypothetical protein [Pseudovibrio sp. POLY-S9]|uniref:hypothetical protein n=1 Tax=Pseudovibrio sp. POLY-S9 TaxID=1576596 RepID=UPI000AA2A8F1|nr:hypothetical protein [Pseudovibrio sp. POLY-S9]
MKILFLAIFNALALIIASTSAQAIIEKLHFNDNIITFSNVSMINGSAPDDICLKRYGEELATRDHPDSTKFSIKRMTDKGHDITVASRSINVTEGIFSIESRYEVLFPDDDSQTPVHLTITTTGLIGDKEATGLFSDGTCRGAIKVKNK